MINFIDVNYNDLTKEKSNEMYSLRKKVFKDRLDWQVLCTENMEFDEYDSPDTTYLIGVYKEKVLCSLRVIEILNPNMITGTFSSCFKQFEIPQGNYIESSRFFVDKDGVSTFGGEQTAITLMLFLSIISYSLEKGYDGILTIVSHAMYTILKRSGMNPSVVGESFSNSNDRIYLLFIKVDDNRKNVMIERISKRFPTPSNKLNQWPLTCQFMLRQV